MTAGPSESPSASERAYRVIRDRILDGTLVPGTMLGENTLAADLGVSRTPVRVALARLQDEGWIAIYPKRGALVQGVSERTVAELADARFVLETTAVDRASGELRQRLAERLEHSIDEQRAAFADKDVRRFIDLTLRFHRGFVEAGGNSVLLELYDQLSDRHRFVLFASGEHLLTRCADIIAEHATLVDHLRAGNAAEFAKTLRGHIAENAPVAAVGRDMVEFTPAFEK
ncbi:transcriptional regulator [Rhodococcus pyridinivorans KG-16]|uniref:Transcriptional regulator n=2 Tax=Rhodococcus pyridinivorans TaxID=103816 RepID=A0A0V9UEA7_9NOCA|nr:transcriptional regulator [Rhodococcus pyridinivorans KG-16]